MYEDWSRQEVELIVADYLAMLADELAGRRINKAARNRDLQRLLNGRSRGSIEFKHCNISAVLIELGYPHIYGYKPRDNYQGMLLDEVASQLSLSPQLVALAAAAVAVPATATSTPPADWRSLVVQPPARKATARATRERSTGTPTVVQGPNFLEQESRNASLGIAGERLVVQLEHRRLWEAGRRALANRVEHVAHTRGDGLGYDVLSFEVNGRERLIEVKTTRYSEFTPFFATRNEVEVSDRDADRYQLYRVFTFDTKPRLFILPGSLRKSVILDAVNFRASLP
jgi:Domain of unknown function (DUF3883)